MKTVDVSLLKMHVTQIFTSNFGFPMSWIPNMDPLVDSPHSTQMRQAFRWEEGFRDWKVWNERQRASQRDPTERAGGKVCCHLAPGWGVKWKACEGTREINTNSTRGEWRRSREGADELAGRAAAAGREATLPYTKKKKKCARQRKTLLEVAPQLALWICRKLSQTTFSLWPRSWLPCSHSTQTDRRKSLPYLQTKPQ